ncbi:unnamed protein product [marine sediment metagenome]|uniref:B12-binding domain-containing protein n=1 Tax=marine sediment metagenome TaxID=412755 RepID=X1LZA2_9ZZZZ
MQKKRILIGTLGVDQHEVGSRVVSRILRDAGMEVIYIGRFNTPKSIIKTTIEESVNVIGLSCYSWEYLSYVPELIDLLKKEGIDIPVVVGGGIFTKSDELKLKEIGVQAVFGPGTSSDRIVQGIEQVIQKVSNETI